MKYLYKILRLFFCPHKYIIEIEKSEINTHNYFGSKASIGTFIIKECCYCHKTKSFNHRI